MVDKPFVPTPTPKSLKKNGSAFSFSSAAGGSKLRNV